MLKQLLLSAAVAAVAFTASAETKVLWSAENAETGELATWGQPLLSLTPEQSAEIKVGDVLTFTVVSADSEIGWPQVAVFEGGIGWPPVANVGVGGKDSYPYVAEFPVAGSLAEILDKGIDFKGDAAYVSEIALITSDKVYDPNTVWFGPKTCGWGDGISLGKELFADVKAGDRIVVEYDKEAAEHTLQFLFGGWNGLNLPTYEAWKMPFMNVDDEAGTITIDLIADLEKLEWEVEGEAKEYDVFALLKESGLIMQGPCTVDAILYIPAVDFTAANQEAYEAVMGEIEILTNEFQAAVAEIVEVNPDYDLTEWMEIIGGALDMAAQGAAQALAAANEDGEEFTYAFDGEEIENMIYAMIEDAKTSGIESINAAVAAGNAVIYTIDGKMVDAPVNGLNIVVTPTSTSKVYIRK
ncbi:MAG: hypothetical protein K2K37_06175 [Muribaculaceae bacterium]|nr:hypothetical protein [Muribaculaceae bacterium]